MKQERLVFMTGASGFMGRALAARLLERGQRVRALVRAGSERRVPGGCEIVFGNPLDRATFAEAVNGADTFVQLVGTAHPSPAKAKQFVEIDLKSGLESVAAAASAGIHNFVYVSVAHPAPVMQSYISVRLQVERAIAQAGLNAVVIRPWYVLGPGRRWPLLLLPFYKLAELIPATRAGAQRLGLVTQEEMLETLVAAVESQPKGVRVVEVPEIRRRLGRVVVDSRAQRGDEDRRQL